MTRRKYTQESITAAINDIQNGLKPMEAAKKYNIVFNSLGWHLRAKNIEYEKKRKIATYKKTEILKDLDSDMTIAQIAKKNKVSRQTIYNIREKKRLLTDS